MIAIISSCINPLKTVEGKTVSHIPMAEREEQTIQSINQLAKIGFERIIILDNSTTPYDFSEIIKRLDNTTAIPLKQYQFNNKGVNELLMLLAVVDELPPDKVIFKISARYFPNKNFTKTFDTNYDFKIKGYEFYKKRGTMSTRAYFVKNKIVYKDFLLQTLNEVFLYPQRIVGFRSLGKLLLNIFKPSTKPYFNTSIEFAGARILKNEYKVELVDSIGIEGVVAGSESNNRIVE